MLLALVLGGRIYSQRRRRGASAPPTDDAPRWTTQQQRGTVVVVPKAELEAMGQTSASLGGDDDGLHAAISFNIKPSTTPRAPEDPAPFSSTSQERI